METIESFLNRASLALSTAQKFQAALTAGTWTDRHGMKHELTETERRNVPVKMLKLVQFADRNLTAAGK